MTVEWQPSLVGGAATAYEVGLAAPTDGGVVWEPVPSGLSHRVGGLVTGLRYGFEVRGSNADGTGPPSPRVYAAAEANTVVLSTLGRRVELLDAARQSFILRLGEVDVRVTVWWQPTDGHWYATLEVPVNTVVVSGRRLVVGSGLLDRVSDVLGGNLGCRSLTELGQVNEPDRGAWREGTHGLFWEPAP